MTWFSLADFGVLLPAIVLAAGALAALLVDPLFPRGEGRAALPYLALGTVAVAAVALLAAWARPAVAVNGSIALGPFAAFVGLVVLAATGLAAVYSIGYARALGFHVGEYYGLLLLAATGMVLLVAANELVSLFVAFELMSISVYCLVAIRRGDARASEAAMKYFVLGAFSSGFLLYGLALLYGATGTIYLDEMAGAARGGGGIVLAALGMLAIAFGFKVGAVPFHAWLPDAYTGAPAGVTGFMAAAVKAAAFGIFVRVLAAVGAFGGAGAAAGAGAGAGGAAAGGAVDAGCLLEGLLWALAAATMIAGNLAALTQSNVKRLLAYSAIAHSGYVLVGLAAGGRAPEALAGALFYLVAYGAMAIGSFAVLAALRREGRDVEDVEDLAGLARERPGVALAMAIFMASFIGIPATAGFMGKLWIFKAAVAAGMVWLVVLALVMTAVSIYYYLRVIAVMYTGEPAPAVAGAAAREASWAPAFAIGAAAIATLLFGLFPAATLDAATRAIATVLPR